MLNSFEMDTIREIKARVLAKKPVAAWEKQMVLDLLRREGGGMTAAAKAAAERQGFSTEGIKAL
jgi:hypothetical protein